MRALGGRVGATCRTPRPCPPRNRAYRPRAPLAAPAILQDFGETTYGNDALGIANDRLPIAGRIQRWAAFNHAHALPLAEDKTSDKAGRFPARQIDTIQLIVFYSRRTKTAADGENYLIEVAEAKRHSQTMISRFRCHRSLAILKACLLVVHVAGFLIPQMIKGAPLPIQLAYIKASNTAAGDNFGWAVAVSEDTLVIGAPFESSNTTGVNGVQTNRSASKSGAAYVLVRTGTNWSQQAYLKGSNTEADDNFGKS